LELLRYGLQFLNVVARSRTAAVAEVLFLRKQLAYYRDLQIRPRRLTDVARLSLVLGSRLFDWREALKLPLVEYHEQKHHEQTSLATVRSYCPTPL